MDDVSTDINSASDGDYLIFNDSSGKWTAGTPTSASYISSASFNTGTGVITGSGTGSAGFTVDIDGRYLTSISGQSIGSLSNASEGSVSGNILIWDEDSGGEFVVESMSGDATMDKSGVVTIASHTHSAYSPTSHTHDVIQTQGNYVWSASTTAGSLGTGIKCSFVASAQGFPNYGAVLHVGARGGGDAGGDYQLYCGHGSNYGGNHLRFRNADNDASPTDSWTGWKTILDSGNYSSYASPTSHTHSTYLPLSGGSLTGVVYTDNGGYFQPLDAGGNSGMSGTYHYGWGYQESGAWSHPFPDLVIGYHTGMKLGANTSYGGIKFYDEHPSVGTPTEIFSVGNGDSHVRVTNNIYWSGGNSANANTAYTHSQSSHAPSNANYITNNNQLTNGAGYITSIGSHDHDFGGVNLSDVQSGESSMDILVYDEGKWTPSSLAEAGCSATGHTHSYLPLSGGNLTGHVNLGVNYGVTGSSAPNYNQAMLELQTSSNYTPAIGFHRAGYSATTLYEYDGRLFVNAWTTRDQTGELLTTGNYSSYASPTSHTHSYLPLSGGSLTGVVYTDSGGYFQPLDAGGNSGMSSVYSYGWGYQEAGAWSHPYPDLVIGYHTGMKFGGAVGYGGCRFYDDHPSRTTTEIFSVGNGDSHVRVTNNLYVGGTVYLINTAVSLKQYASDLTMHANDDINLESRWIRFYDTSSVEYTRISYSGGWFAGAYTFTGDVTAYYSDSRLKDFHGVIENPLDKVMKLNGYYFTENEKAKELGFDNDRMQVGVSAQEIEEVLPELIKDAPIGHGYKTIDYGKITPLLIEAIKELKNEINQLKGINNG
jgi:hypothetical protein